MKKYMPLEGLRWSRDSGSALYDTPQNGRSRTGWGGVKGLVKWFLRSLMCNLLQKVMSTSSDILMMVLGSSALQ